MVYQEQAQKCTNIIKTIQGSHDINKSPEKYYDLDQSRIKGIYLDKSLKTYSLIGCLQEWHVRCLCMQVFVHLRISS